MPADHAKFSPSSLKRVMACAASYAHEQALAELEPSPRKAFGAARDGTVAHALAEFCLTKGVDPRALAGKKLDVSFDKKVETVEIEKDVADKVAVYVEHCNTLAMLADRRFIEKEVHVTTEVNGNISCDLLWGTADFIAIADGARIDVVDLKFGMTPVEPGNNPQLVTYLLGALELLPESKRPNKGALHIVQPRLSHEPKIWEIEDLQALRSEWLPRLEKAMERAIGAAMLTVPVEGYYEAGEHCHFCPILTTCSHFAKRMIEITTQELEEVTPEGVLFSDRYVALLERWKAKSLITRYYEQLEQKLADEIRKGTKIPGLKIVEALGHRKWAFDDSAMISRFRNLGIAKKHFVVQSVISPAQAEKLITDKKFFTECVVRPRTEKLALDSDKRQAINPGAELEVIDQAPAPEQVKREAPKQSATMALIDLGESMEATEQAYLENIGSPLDENGIDLGMCEGAGMSELEENEEIEEIEL